MQLEKIAIELRPRSGFEAIDLGFRMALHWARPLWTVWLVVFVPVALALILALDDWPWLPLLLLWWLKPLFERFLLHVLSRSVFGAPPSLLDTLGAWREILSPSLARSLLSRFWDFGRSFSLPVTQLERQKGKPAAQRRRLLGRRVGSYAYALTLVCMHFEMVVFYGLAALGLYLAPDLQLLPESEQFSDLMDVANWWTAWDTLLYLICISLIAPFYVAAGFALYLNRRVMLEAWDLELALRRMAARHAGRAARSVLALPLLGLLLVLAPAQPLQASDGPVLAQFEAELEDWDDYDEDDESTQVGPPAPAYAPLDTQARRRVLELLADESFGGEREVVGWRPRDRASERNRIDRTPWASVGEVIATVLRVLAWLLLGVAGIVLVYALMRSIGLGRREASAGTAAPAQLFGLAIAPDSLPSDIPAAAQAALAAGHLREALSLLYRGALSHLVHRCGLRVGAGATEGDVLSLARARLPQQPVEYFSRLLPAWIQLAYGARPPTPETVMALIAEHAQAMPGAAEPLA